MICPTWNGPRRRAQGTFPSAGRSLTTEIDSPISPRSWSASAITHYLSNVQHPQCPTCPKMPQNAPSAAALFLIVTTLTHF